MNYSIGSEFILTVFVQFALVVSIFATLRERVKGLEADLEKVLVEQNEAKSKHETIAKIDAKLDILLKYYLPKT